MHSAVTSGGRRLDQTTFSRRVEAASIANHRAVERITAVTRHDVDLRAAAERLGSQSAGNLDDHFLLGRGVGTQGYVCLPTGTGASWTVKGARPEATLFTTFFGHDVQIITHFLSPNTNPNQFAPNPLPFANATWQSSFDSSRVWAQAQHAIPGGSDPASCSHSGAISCLLLQVIGAEQGPTGGKSLAATTFIQRLNTQGGLAPATGCSVPTDVGKQTLVPYSADYYFFHGGVN